MNPWITAQVVYLSIYLLAVYTGKAVANSRYQINGTQTNAKVYTTADPGVDIRTVRAYDTKTNLLATSYQLLSPRPAYFVINRNTGTISTARKIQQPVGYRFVLTVIAQFSDGDNEHRQLYIDVVQVNRKQPRFASSQIQFIIHQRTKIGTKFGQIRATDQSAEEYNRKLTYSIKMHSGPEVFGVDKNGILRVIGPIPRNTAVLNFTALASDNGYPTKTAWQLVSVKISNIPALTKFCTVKEGHNWRICWKYEPPSSQRYVYHIEVRHGNYTHNNSEVGGTEHCYNTALLDDAAGKYFFRVQTRLGNNKSPFSDWKEAVDKGPDCELFDPCYVHNPCSNGGSCIHKTKSSSILEERYTCICPHGWQGIHCRTKDPCTYTACQNQGTCVMINLNQTRCDCLDGYLGEFCEFADPCASNPCLNGARCQVRAGALYECHCLPFYEGENCEIHDPCYSTKCKHGTCNLTEDDTPHCICEKGYTGRFCELYDPCSFYNPCHNNGTCVPDRDAPSKYICKCTENYIGENCSQIYIDPCKFIHCKNGGTCSISGPPGQHCKCRPGFIGGECQREDKCYGQQQCKNGATCSMNDDDTFVCHCTNGFTGELCELIDPCATGSCDPNTSSSCLRLSDTKYRCSCLEGYTGDLCETAITRCQENTCRNNGNCTDEKFGYLCHCKAGFYGVHCDEMDPCRNHKCKNGATCRGLNNGHFRCYCPTGLSGTYCETLTFCSSTTCLNGGNCSNGAEPNDTSCTCFDDYFGRQCQHFNFCSPHNNPCLNKGKCVLDFQEYSSTFTKQKNGSQAFWKKTSQSEKGKRNQLTFNALRNNHVYNSYHCECSDGFTGGFCQHATPGCLTGDRCKNGGTCVEPSTCICPPNFSGLNCELPLYACLNETCLNGGSCTDQPGHKGYTCSCMPFFQGDNCEVKMNCSNSSPCNNRSKCIDTEDGFRCECSSPLSGTNCTTKAFCNETIEKDDTGSYIWPFTFYGRTAKLPCNYFKEFRENAFRPCIFNTTLNRAEWGRMDTSRCEKIGDEEASKAMKNLRSMTEDPQTLTAEQVANVTEKLEEIFSYSLKNKEMADNMVQVISNMLEANTSVMDASNKMNKTSKRLTLLLDEFTANVSIPEKTLLELKSPNVILTTGYFPGSAFKASAENSVNLNPTFENDKKTKLEFTIPSSALSQNPNLIPSPERIQMIAYNNAKFYIGQNQSETNVSKQNVIFVKVKGRELKNLTNPVTYIISNIESNKNHTCVYWDTTKNDWSTEGIVTRSIDFNQTLCESNHLTSFSLLLDPSPENPLPEIHETVLTYISYIGCGISLFGIILTIITYGLFGCLHGDPSGRILLNLCSSLLFLNVAFLMASQVTTLQEEYSETSAETLCIIVTILIHYFLLTTLAWMCVEALNMYQLLVTVFNIYHSRFMLKRVLAAWGLPALTVGITLGADIRNYKTKVGFCFLSYGNQTAFYVSLLTPACVILFINTVVFGMVTKVIMRPKFKNKHQCTSNVSGVQVRGCFTVMVLLGVTWLFGPLAINEMKVLFNYIFCIFNSLQGFFIFVFRCLLNPEAKMAWVQLIKMGTLKKKKGPRKSVDSSSNGLYGGGGAGGQLGHRWSQKTMTVDIRDNTNLKKLSKQNDNGIYEKNVSYKSCGTEWEHRNGSTYKSDSSKPVEFTRL